MSSHCGESMLFLMRRFYPVCLPDLFSGEGFDDPPTVPYFLLFLFHNNPAHLQENKT